MGKLRRWAAAALCGAVFAGGVLAVAAACAACPGWAWLTRGALFLQDPGAAAAVSWPADAAQTVYKPQQPDRRRLHRGRGRESDALEGLRAVRQA